MNDLKAIFAEMTWWIYNFAQKLSNFICQESLTILEKVKRRNPLEAENKYCVISFNTENHDNHKKMLKSSVEGKREKNLSETAYVITDEKSVLNIPNVKVILVFIDKHHSDEILETPGEDVNDIKLLTVQTCRKMGGRYTTNFDFHIPDLSCVYIVYILFSSHNHPKGRVRYCHHFTSVFVSHLLCIHFNYVLSNHRTKCNQLWQWWSLEQRGSDLFKWSWSSMWPNW